MTHSVVGSFTHDNELNLIIACVLPPSLPPHAPS